MKKREVNYIKKIARERGRGEETKRPNKWPAIKKKAKRKPMPKMKGTGQTILIKDNEVL